MRSNNKLKAILAIVGFAATTLANQASADPEPIHHDYFKTSDGINIHYMQMGETGSHVVLIHGYTGSAEGNWFRNGIAQALATNHRVVAIDCRNHGLSDKPQPRGGGRAEDVIEMMDHLGIGKAHIHGYSMGGGITARLLASHPERFLTAGFGGSGIREVDPERIAELPPDKQGTDPEEAIALHALRISAAMTNGATREEAEKLADNPPPRPTRRNRSPRPSLDIDLAKVEIAVLAINGELDRPIAKTQRLARELKNFTNVVLPGKSHLTAIVAPYMPKQYVESLVDFIDTHDVQ